MTWWGKFILYARINMVADIYKKSWRRKMKDILI